jgi:AcrR family transcriptional regulator
MTDMTTPGALVEPDRCAATEPDRRAPGRPRNARADQAIIDAVLEMIAEGHTVDALSVEAVAARAGVGKATIYRRWPNKEAMVIDAVATMKGPVPQVRGESVRDDLVTLLGRTGVNADGSRTGRIMSCLAADLYRNAELQRCYQAVVEPRRAAVRDVLRRGVRSGELRADLDVELAVNLLTGPILVQSAFGWNPALDPADLASRVVDTLLVGIGGPGSDLTAGVD